MKVTYINKKAIVLTLTIIFATITSCKKYLDISPKSSFDTAFVFGSVTNATNAVLGVYGHLTGDQGYGSRLSTFYTVDTDESIGTSNTSAGGGDNGPKAMARYNATSENSILELPFNQLYSGIESANICIKNIPAMALYTNGSAGEQAALKRLYGEALALRAQFYFEIIRNWGDVPAQFVPSSDIKDLNLPKTDRDIIYEHLLEDLKTAEDLVPWRKDPGVVTDERIKKGGIKALRAKIALFRGGYSLRKSGQMERKADYLTYYKIARDECKDIIDSKQHALNPTFQAVFKDNIDAHTIEPNGEVLFEVALAGALSATDGRLGGIDGPQVGASPGGGVKMLPTYYYAFNQLDTRMATTVCDYSVTTSNFKQPQNPAAAILVLFSGKFRRDWQTNPTLALTDPTLYTGVNWPIIRYSDVLLMFAEADNEINGSPSAEAINAFETVRKRAFKGNETSIGITPTDKQGFFNAVVDERWLEFGGEGVRKYDLIRWNLLGQKLAECKANLNKMVNKEAPYANLPTARYYKNSSVDMIWLNSMYAPAPATGPAGYTKATWTTAISPAFITNIADSYKPNHGELLPLPQALINSNPNVKNDYGY
ncbi:RagB/SusD family nutrient uptake outer membrane protein [Mucilaginibacter sp.]|jgi:hypothetical protein|uniref:RagB/SusD family nutrient uptake outer membrane protein n=1 Tax=Mucilaginibacter sp. TaxID=1882438 RepID=UPI00356B417E